MRKDQFIKEAASYNRRSTAIFVIPLLLAFGFIIAYGPFQRRFEAYLDSRIAGPVPDILRLLPVAIPFLLALCAIIPLTRRNDRDMGVACPHCGNPLAQFKGIVIASKNCPYCGKKVLDDEL
jgi:DNA-directed RNA polymerase subunit RPC12/RpoP